MSGKRVLVTGSTGFIGQQLVRCLIQKGHRVTAMVRRSSDVTELRRLGVPLVVADFSDLASLQTAVAGQEVVYHLAAVARAVNLRDFKRVNEDGLVNLLHACVLTGRNSNRLNSPQRPSVGKPGDGSSALGPVSLGVLSEGGLSEVVAKEAGASVSSRLKRPRLVLVSSLAAVGPCPADRPHHESAAPNPVSHYGKSKWSAERLAVGFSDRLHISIVRPPVVLGHRDRRGLNLFKTVNSLGLLLVPRSAGRTCSVIHVADLAEALIAVAERGKSITPLDAAAGIYFAAADEILTMRQLAELVGQALGKPNPIVIPVPGIVCKAIGAVNTAWGAVRKKPLFLNADKISDMMAGSWSCGNEKLKSELGFVFGASIGQRFDQTVGGYRRQGWLPPLSTERAAPSSPPTGAPSP